MTQQLEGADSDAPIDVSALPRWTPDAVRDVIKNIEQMNLTFAYRPILRRLAFDVRMDKVWIELQKKSKSGGFFHQARPRDDTDLRTNEELQSAGLRELVLYAVIAAFEKRPVAKPEEVEAARNTALRYAQALNDVAADMALAMTRGELGLTETLEVKQLAESDRLALLRVADWYTNYTRGLRRPDSPLMVEKHRSDPIERGVLISIADKLEFTFGKRLDRTAAAIASVALGTKIGGRPARSALTKRGKKKARKSSRRK
jgi:hypothetical protein